MSSERSRALVVVAALLLAACSPRGDITYGPASAPQVAVVRSVFVATTRNALPEGQFGPLRAPALSFARYDVSIPQNRKAGDVSWPGHERPDPARHFLTTGIQDYSDSAGFWRAIGRSLAQYPWAKREVVVFVHGFNTTFAEGVYRAAQMGRDFDLSGVVVHYSWPSAANPVNYAYDRDSALYARRGLVDLIEAVQGAGARRVVIAAHSMGSLLTMEALEQIDLRNPGAAARDVQSVALLSPDIDPEVFLSQARTLRRLPEDFVVVTSRRDRALGLSALITGQRQRLGNIADVSSLAELPITFLDITNFSEGSGHFDAAKSPALIELLSKARTLDEGFRSSQSSQIGLIPGTVLRVRQVTQIILLPVTDPYAVGP